VATLERSSIEEGLLGKGFVTTEKHHRYFHHAHEGRETGAYAFTSRGSKFKTYGPELIARMKKTLRLDTNQQVVDLVLCPMSADDYLALLREKRVL
jgi:hypothetical protein